MSASHSASTRFKLDSGTECVIARPAESVANGYGLVIAPDMVGLRSVFDEAAARIASKQGWVVTSPEPFPGHEDWDVWQRYDFMAEVDAPAQLADVLAAADATGC